MCCSFGCCGDKSQCAELAWIDRGRSDTRQIMRLWEEGFKDARRFHYSHVAGSECSSEFLFVGAGCAPLACHKQSVILYHTKVSPKHHPMCQHKGIQRDMLPRLGRWCGGTIKPASPWCKPLFDMLEPLLFLPAWCFKPRISITHYFVSSHCK